MESLEGAPIKVLPGHVISYPEALNDPDNPEIIRIKAELLFQGNNLLKDLPKQFDDCVTVLKTKDDQVLMIHNVTCSICGSMVAGSKTYTQRHLELHIKHGD